MEHYRKSSHTIYDIKYDVIWMTKCRKPVLTGEIAKRARELIREICRSLDVEIVRGHLSKDHVHLMVSVPPHVWISHFVKYLKGKSPRKLMMEYRALSRTFWGRYI